MISLIRWIEMLTAFLGKFFGWLIIPLVLSLCYEVFARYLFKSPTIWAFDITYMLMSAIFLSGAALTLSERRHIRIDFLYNRFSPKIKAISDLTGLIVLISPAVFYVCYFTIIKFFWSIEIGELSEWSPWRPALWPFRGFIALGYSLLSIQCLAEILKQLTILFGKEE